MPAVRLCDGDVDREGSLPYPTFYISNSKYHTEAVLYTYTAPLYKRY